MNNEEENIDLDNEIEDVVETVITTSTEDIKGTAFSPNLAHLEGEIGHKICCVCKEKLMQEEVHFLNCSKCQALYCVHFASSIDPLYCSECNNKVELTDQTYTRTDTITSEDGQRSYTKKSSSRQLIFSGLDWLFFQRKIYSLNDTELALAIEYHHTIYQSMLAEREKRKIEYFHRHKNNKYPVRLSTGDTLNSNSSTTSTIKQTTVTKTVKASKQEAALKTVVSELLKQGLSATDIANMFKK